MPRPRSYRFSLYALVNGAFLLFLGIAYGLGNAPDPRLLYLVLLFALCSTILIDFDGLNGPYALLGMFMLVYFVSFGVVDVTNLLKDGDLAELAPTPTRSDALSRAEIVILVGGMMLVLGYRIAAGIVSAVGPIRRAKEWSKIAVVIVGLLLWVIGTIATYRWNVYVVSDSTNEAYRKGLASVSTATVTLYIIFQMCQPVGMLLIAYAYRVFRSPYLFPIVVAVVGVQLFIGFVVDVKGMAMLGMILVIMTNVLVEGRFPKIWLACFLLFVIFLFPFFQAYRSAIHGGGIARTAVVENFLKVLETTIAAKDKINSGRDRAQTFWERSSVKGSVEIVVTKTGNGVDFEHGYTLSPILLTFVPKILAPDKVRIPTGQLFNKKFHIFDDDDIYVSPSHLGELYWNFGWRGAVFGMAIIGAICGFVGAYFNLMEYRTVTRVLVMVITIKQLIVGFEGSIAELYVVWLRSLVGIGILHLIFARTPVVARFFRGRAEGSRATHGDESRGTRLFPNLLT
jgi:hypothetical protein